jgi:hypothetical protein
VERLFFFLANLVQVGSTVPIASSADSMTALLVLTDRWELAMELHVGHLAV